MLIVGTKTIICSLSDIQIYLGTLYFYVLNLAPLTGRDFIPIALESKVGRQESERLQSEAGWSCSRGALTQGKAAPPGALGSRGSLGVPNPLRTEALKQRWLLPHFGNLWGSLGCDNWKDLLALSGQKCLLSLVCREVHNSPHAFSVFYLIFI